MTPLEQSGLEPSGPKTNARLIALVEFAAFLAFALISKRVLDDYFWRYSGPVSLVITLLVLSGYMRLRGWSWTDMGLPKFPGPGRGPGHDGEPGGGKKRWLALKVVLTFVAFGVAVATVLLGSEALGLEFMKEEPQRVEDRWGSVRGNLPEYLGWLAIVWTAAAFGEEMFFRGFLITQLQRVFGSTLWASILAVVLAALVFGYGHYYYQGLRGLILTGAIGLAFGTCFLLFKRNLWPIIIIHGCIDTLTFTAMYMGWE